MSGQGSDDTFYVELQLDSLDGTQTQQYIATTDWPTFNFSRDLPNVAAIKVLQAEIPFSYSVVNETNNTFSLAENLPVNSTLTVTLPIGNYTSTTLATTLASSLNASSPNAKTYTVVFSSTTNKFTITTTDADPAFRFSLLFGTSANTGQDNPRFVLGFPGGESTADATFTLTAPFSAQISGPNYVYLNSDSLGQMSNTMLPTGALNLGKGSNGPQMTRIPITCNPGGVTFYNDPDPDKWFDMENLSRLSGFDLYLTLGNQNPGLSKALKLNGQGFSVKIGLLLYKQSRVQQQNVRNSGSRRIFG